MKYMGSKSVMLRNGLGELLLDQAKSSIRFIDLFCGSAAVSWFVGERENIPVISCDLQKYSYFLARSVIGRTSELTSQQMLIAYDWINAGREYYNEKVRSNGFEETEQFVVKNRLISERSLFLMVRAYGGYYFSNSQITTFNYLLSKLPQETCLTDVLMASLIEAASSCAASPGHTAQPFQPKGNGLIAIKEAWVKDPIDIIKGKIEFLNEKFAKVQGEAFIMDSHLLLNDLKEGDLVFLDPPYSGVHYSRFYHVLESLARQKVGHVTGQGRYPEPEQRPRSNYSLKGKSVNSLQDLFAKISEKKAKAIITFPNGTCSNGLSGEIVKNLARLHFKVSKELIKGRFSTLGGNNANRPARQECEELVLLLEPK